MMIKKFRKISILAFTLAGAFFTVNSIGSITSLASEVECKKARFNTRISKFMESGGIGSFGFSFNRNPPTVQRVSAGDCYEIPKKMRGKRIYFFMNHLSTDERRHASFLAVQLVKYYKNLRFDADRVTGIRKGLWSRDVDGETLNLPEIGRMSSFRGISPEQFGLVHATRPFDERPLLIGLGGKFWHGEPLSSDVSSLDRLAYWANKISDNPHVKIENYLIRFEALALKERPINNKNGIPLDTRYHSGLEKMDLSVRSPADGGIQIEFSLR